MTATVSFDWLAHHARNRPTKTAVIDLGTERQFTYAEVNERTERLAAALAATFHVKPGDRVAVLSKNTSNIFEVQFACWKLGAIFVPLSWRLAVPELEYIVNDCTPSVVIHGDEFREQAVQLTQVSHRVAWDEGADGVDEYEALLATTSSDRPSVDNTLDTVLTIMYTSGTTGRPKGVIITHGMTLWNVFNQTELFRTSSAMVNLVVLPLFHTGGLNCFANPAFHYGGTNVVMGAAFDPALGLRLLSDSDAGITHLQSVPANYLFMSQCPEFADATFPSIVAAGVGGSPAPHTLLDAWIEKGVYLQQAFGMTETGSMVMALPREDARRKLGSTGLPFLHNAVRIVDPEGRDVEPGAVGELWVKGPNITTGYWGLPETTAASLTDGWLHTGDALRQDEEGYFYVIDRLKDIYISGGENVSPAEVENVLYQLEAIAECAVIGVPDDRWQEVGQAFIVLKPGAVLGDAEIVEHCSTRLAKFKIPKSVVFLDQLPHNATGKILKRELNALHLVSNAESL